jgi:hypothetical protein
MPPGSQPVRGSVAGAGAADGVGGGVVVPPPSEEPVPEPPPLAAATTVTVPCIDGWIVQW